MRQQTIDALRAHLVHLGAMPGEAEIMANFADNNMPNGVPSEDHFSTALEIIKKHFVI